MHKYQKLDAPEIIKHFFSAAEEEQPASIAGENTLSTAISSKLEKVNHFTCGSYTTEKDAPVIVYFPAIGESADAVRYRAESYQTSGINVIVARYRQQPLPAEDTSWVTSLLTNASELLAAVLAELQEQEYTGLVFLVGNGLSNLCVISLAKSHAKNIRGIILESSIGPTVEYLQACGVDTEVLGIHEEDGLGIIENIALIELPVLILHGAKDPLVSVTEAECIHANCGARSKQFFVIPGATRGDIPQVAGKLYFQTIKSHIDKLCGVTRFGYKKKQRKTKMEGNDNET